jgi:hypothetical protein
MVAMLPVAAILSRVARGTRDRMDGAVSLLPPDTLGGGPRGRGNQILRPLFAVGVATWVGIERKAAQRRTTAFRLCRRPLRR